MRKKHGMAETRLYKTYTNMKQRCNNPNDPKYNSYGGKGIRLCDEWNNNASSFLGWALANGYSDELTIDRIDSTKDYCPENCRWITFPENQLRRWYSGDILHRMMANQRHTM